jgi:hypothetical protein
MTSAESSSSIATKTGFVTCLNRLCNMSHGFSRYERQWTFPKSWGVPLVIRFFIHVNRFFHEINQPKLAWVPLKRWKPSRLADRNSPLSEIIPCWSPSQAIGAKPSPGAHQNRKLVGGLEPWNFIFFNSWDDDPIWLINIFNMFQRGGSTTNQESSWIIFSHALRIIVLDDLWSIYTSCIIMFHWWGDHVDMTPRGKFMFATGWVPTYFTFPCWNPPLVVFCILF